MPGRIPLLLIWLPTNLVYIVRSAGIWRPDACRWVGSSLAQVRLICLLGSRKSFLCFVCSRSTVWGVRTIYFISWKKRKLKKSRSRLEILGRTKAKTKFRWASCSNRTSWRKRIRPLRNSSLQVLLYTTSILKTILFSNLGIRKKGSSFRRLVHEGVNVQTSGLVIHKRLKSE